MKYRWPRMRVRIELALLFLGIFGSFLTIGSVISRYAGEPAVVHLCFGALCSSTTSLLDTCFGGRLIGLVSEL